MLNNKNILVTGGAGFIGSHLVDMLLQQNNKVVVLDALTYAGNLQNLSHAKLNTNFTFVHGNICDTHLVSQLLNKYKIEIIFHLAAESHVDNSILSPGAFVQTNINGTYSMLYAALQYWESNGKPEDFRFIHISTDEVFGQLTANEPPFNEQSPYKPNSPYSASKAGSDLLVRSWHQTYKFPAIITHASNNFGPRQHSEKFIPTVIRCALHGKNIPIYGTGKNIRDWLFVQDFCQGLILAASLGQVGQSYCFGGNNELTNNDLALMITAILDRMEPKSSSYTKQICHVTDRKGHDFRYAIDASKAQNKLDWKISNDFICNLEETIDYYDKIFIKEPALAF